MLQNKSPGGGDSDGNTRLQVNDFGKEEVELMLGSIGTACSVTGGQSFMF